MKNFLRVFAASLVLLASAARADTLTSAVDILNFAIEKNSRYESFSAHVVQVAQIYGGSAKAIGDVSFKKPALLRMQTSLKAEGQQIKQLTVNRPDSDQVFWMETIIGASTNIVKIDFRRIPPGSPAATLLKNPMEQMPAFILKDLRDHYDVHLEPTTDCHSVPAYVLLGISKIAARPIRLKYFIDQSTGLICRIDQLDAAGSSQNTTEFFDFKTDVPLKDDFFQYEPPAGVEVKDVSQSFPSSR